MVLAERKDRLLQYIAYSIVIAAFTMAVIFPLVLQFTTPFAAPTAVYSKWIVNTGHLSEGGSFLTAPYDFWKQAISVQIQYPLSSVLVSVFMLITGISFQYAMLLPLAAIGNLIYFVLARYILNNLSSNKGLVLLFSALYYLSFTSAYIYAGDVGYADLGLTFLAFFIYVYLRFSSKGQSNNSKSNSFGLVVILLLLILAIGELYYFATIDIIALMALVTIVTAVTKKGLPRKRFWLEFSIAIIAIFLFVNKTNMIAQIQTATIQNMFSNFAQYIGTLLGRLGIKLDWLNTLPTVFNIQLIQFDPITLLGNRIWIFTQSLSLIAIIACLFTYRPRNTQRSPKNLVWLFCVFLLFLSVGELGYFASGPAAPTRLLVLYGPIVTLSILIMLFPESLKCRKLKLRGFKYGKLKLVVTFLVILLFCLSIWGELRLSLIYGKEAGRPFAYEYASPVSDFLCAHTANYKPIVLTGDEGYVADVFFITSLYNKTALVVAEPLLGDAITLNEAITTGDPHGFLLAMQSRQIGYLLIINDGKPLYGDAWGYLINGPTDDTISQLSFNPVYDDGRAHLFQLFPGSGS